MSVSGTGTRVVMVRAHAKINLDLRLLGIRPDGFHELRTLFEPLDLHDTLVCESRPGPFTLECDVPGVPLDASNLAWRAAQALWTAAGREGDVRDVVVRLTKRIPMQAGLGGGSADAAAALTGLAALWDVRLAPEALGEIGGRLGSDIPFFLEGGVALGVGRGEQLYPLPDLPPHAVLLLVPGFGVSTRDAYGWWDADCLPPNATAAVPDPVRLPGWPGWAGPLRNDLEAPVARRHPRIAELVAGLSAAGATFAAMSGSGSTVFGIFPDLHAATRAAESGPGGQGWGPDVRAVATTALTGDAYRASARPDVR